MKLFLNQASPYARLARALLIETELDGVTELAFVDPWAATDDLLTANPAAKIPALMLDDGTHLIESACIADYLIRRSGRTNLSPLAHLDGEARLRALGLGRAAMDCAFGAVIQQRFAPASPLTGRWLGAVPRLARALDALYAEGAVSAGFDLSDLTVTVAFAYIDFRLADIAWREAAPHLAERVGAVGRRAALRATRPC